MIVGQMLGAQMLGHALFTLRSPLCLTKHASKQKALKVVGA